jgi:hypothetical protein
MTSVNISVNLSMVHYNTGGLKFLVGGALKYLLPTILITA